MGVAKGSAQEKGFEQLFNLAKIKLEKATTSTSFVCHRHGRECGQGHGLGRVSHNLGRPGLPRPRQRPMPQPPPPPFRLVAAKAAGKASTAAATPSADLAGCGHDRGQCCGQCCGRGRGHNLDRRCHGRDLRRLGRSLSRPRPWLRPRPPWPRPRPPDATWATSAAATAIVRRAHGCGQDLDRRGRRGDRLTAGPDLGRCDDDLGRGLAAPTTDVTMASECSRGRRSSGPQGAPQR